MPDSPEWVGAFTGALYPMIFESSWEESEGGITRAAAAAKAQEIFFAYLESACGSVAGRVYRVRTGGIGYLYSDTGGETWVEDNPLGDIPVRTEPTTDDKKCLAARNATEVYKLLLEDTFEAYENNVLPSIALANAISTVAVGIFFPPALVFVEPFFAGVYATFEFLTINDWTPQITEEMTCILVSHATVHPDGSVTFNWEAANNEIGGKILEGRIWLQISYFVNMLGSDALSRAGGTTSIASYSCDACDEDCGIGGVDYDWCITFNYREELYDHAVAHGSWVLGEGIVGAYSGAFGGYFYAQVNFNTVGVSGQYFRVGRIEWTATTNTQPRYYFSLPMIGETLFNVPTGESQSVATFADDPGGYSDLNRLWQTASESYNASGGTTLHEVTFRGWGVKPAFPT